MQIGGTPFSFELDWSGLSAVSPDVRCCSNPEASVGPIPTREGGSDGHGPSGGVGRSRVATRGDLGRVLSSGNSAGFPSFPIICAGAASRCDGLDLAGFRTVQDQVELGHQNFEGDPWCLWIGWLLAWANVAEATAGGIFTQNLLSEKTWVVGAASFSCSPGLWRRLARLLLLLPGEHLRLTSRYSFWIAALVAVVMLLLALRASSF